MQTSYAASRSYPLKFDKTCSFHSSLPSEAILAEYRGDRRFLNLQP